MIKSCKNCKVWQRVSNCKTPLELLEWLCKTDKELKEIRKMLEGYWGAKE